VREETGLFACYRRIVAGLWFGTFLLFAQLFSFALLEFLFGLLTNHFRFHPLPGSFGLSVLLGGACLGGGFGSGILDRKADITGAVTRGGGIAFAVGVLSAFVDTLLEAHRATALLWQLDPASFASVFLPRGFFQGGQLLPFGALAGWCLFSLRRRFDQHQFEGEAP
jgi:hypothetical protein